MQNIKCPVCDSALSISENFDVFAIKTKRTSFFPSQSRVQVLMNIIYLLIGALLAFAGVSLPGCSDDGNDSFADEYNTENDTDTGEGLQDDRRTETAEQLQTDADTDTVERLQTDADTDTVEQLQTDADTDTVEQLDSATDTDTVEQLENIEADPENCPLIEPFLEVCAVNSLQPFKDSCKGGMMTGYTFCVFECATLPLNECEINNIVFDCTNDRCINYKLCMQLCSR